MCKNIKLFGPGTGPREPEGPGTKKSQDLTKVQKSRDLKIGKVLGQLKP